MVRLLWVLVLALLAGCTVASPKIAELEWAPNSRFPSNQARFLVFVGGEHGSGFSGTITAVSGGQQATKQVEGKVSALYGVDADTVTVELRKSGPSQQLTVSVMDGASLKSLDKGEVLADGDVVKASAKR